MYTVYINPKDLAQRFYRFCWCHSFAESPQLQGSEFSRNSKALDPSTRTTPFGTETGGRRVGALRCERAWKMNHLKVGCTRPLGKRTWISKKMKGLGQCIFKFWMIWAIFWFLCYMVRGVFPIENGGCFPCFVMSPKELWNKPRAETVVSWEFFCADHLPWNKDWIQAFQPKALVNHIWNWSDIVESRKKYPEN